MSKQNEGQKKRPLPPRPQTPRPRPDPSIISISHKGGDEPKPDTQQPIAPQTEPK